MREKEEFGSADRNWPRMKLGNQQAVFCSSVFLPLTPASPASAQLIFLLLQFELIKKKKKKNKNRNNN